MDANEYKLRIMFLKSLVCMVAWIVTGVTLFLMTDGGAELALLVIPGIMTLGLFDML